MRRSDYLTIFSITLLMAVGLPQARAQSDAPAGVEKAKFDVSYVPPSAVGVVAAYPRAVLMSKDLELSPREILSYLGVQQAGIDPLDIEQIIVVAEAPGGGPPQVCAIALFSKPPAKVNLLPMFKGQTTVGDLDGKPYQKARNPMAPSIFQPDDKTLIVGTDDLLKKVVANHASPQAGKLSAMLSHVGTPDIVALSSIEPLRPMINAGMASDPPPPPLAGLAKVPDLVQYVAAKIDLTGDLNMALTMRANDEAAAQQIEGILEGAMTFGKQSALQQASMLEASGDPVAKATAQYSKRAMERLCQMFTPVRKGSLLTLAGSGKENFQRILTGAGTAGLMLFRVAASPPGQQFQAQPAAGPPQTKPSASPFGE